MGKRALRTATGSGTRRSAAAAAGGDLRQAGELVSVAPELPGALEFIRRGDESPSPSPI